MSRGCRSQGLILPESIAYGAIAGLPSMACDGRGAGGASDLCTGRAVALCDRRADLGVGGGVGGGTGEPGRGRIGREAGTGSDVWWRVSECCLSWRGCCGWDLSRRSCRARYCVGLPSGWQPSIVLRQVITAAGMHLAAATLPLQLLDALCQVAHWNGVALAIGAVALVALLLLRRWRGVPAAFVVLALAGTASFLIDFPALGVAGDRRYCPATRPSGAARIGRGAGGWRLRRARSAGWR